MPFRFNEETRAIQLAAGDTADLYVAVDWAGLADGDAVLFAVCDRRVEDLLVKAADVADGRAHVRLCNHDTRDLDAGQYRWQLRIVTSPARDESGSVIADACTDDVISVFDSDELPAFRLTRTGARV